MPEPELAARADLLTEAVTRLSDAVNALASNQERMKRALALTVVGLLLDFILTVAGILLFANQRDINHRLIDANGRLESVQLRTSDQVLCPLYKLFITFEPRAKDNPAFTPEERAERARAYEVIHQGYDTLGCH